MKVKKTNKKTAGILLVLVAISFIIAWQLRQDRLKTEAIETTITSAVAPEPEIPDDLYVLTIPYLRQRRYTSTLSLDEVVEQTGTYTVWLAHYFVEGFRVNGLLVVPQGEPPEAGWPGVILVHGYQNPQTYQTNGSSYRAWWQGLAATGEFVVFKIDLRGHGQSQGTPGGAYYGSGYIVDTLTAHTALGQSDLVDAQRIGLWGHSMAGNVLFRALAAKPNLKAVSIWAGAGFTYRDLRAYGITDHSYTPTPRSSPPSTTSSPAATLRQQMFGRGEGSSEPDYTSPFWQMMLPTNYLSDVTGALQLQHAADDEVVSVAYSRDLEATLSAMSVSFPHEYWEYQSGGHNLTANFNLSITRLRDFFRRYL